MLISIDVHYIYTFIMSFLSIYYVANHYQHTRICQSTTYMQDQALQQVIRFQPTTTSDPWWWHLQKASCLIVGVWKATIPGSIHLLNALIWNLSVVGVLLRPSTSHLKAWDSGRDGDCGEKNGFWSTALLAVVESCYWFWQPTLFDSEPNPIQHNLGHTWHLVSFTLSLAQVK